MLENQSKKSIIWKISVILVGIFIGMTIPSLINTAPESPAVPEPVCSAAPEAEPEKDTVPPRLTAVDFETPFEEPVAYLQHAIALDSVDGEVEVKVDKSSVDITTPGTYPVTYTAADKAGNTVSKTVNMTLYVKNVEEYELDQLIDSIFEKILEDDMTTYKKVRAIYKYINNNINYEHMAMDYDPVGNAYYGLTTGHGDCKAFAFSGYYMLKKLGVDVQIAERFGGSTKHYWCIVNLGTGWYHFDACQGPLIPVCMTKYSILQHFSDWYWNIDASKYPEMATEDFVDTEEVSAQASSKKNSK